MRSHAMILALLAGCTQPMAKEPAPPPASTASAPLHVALVVNGRPISEAEVALRMRERGPSRPNLTRSEAIDRVIELELQAQAAEAKGLDEDPAFLAEMELLEAKTRDARRHKLAKHYRMRALADLPEPSAAEVQAFLTANQARLGVEHRVRRVTTRTRADAEQVLAAVRAGKPLDEVARAFPGESLDVGPLGFDTMPEPWWAALEGLAPSAFSDVVQMGDDRFVVLQLVERREVPTPAPDVLERRVRAALQAQAFEARHRDMEADLRKAAKIEIKAAPASTAPRLGHEQE